MRQATTMLPALHALRVHRLRTTLALLGIAFGVASVVLIVAFGSAGQARIDAEIRSLGADVLVVLAGPARSQGAAKEAGSSHTITDGDAEAIAREAAGIAAAAPAMRDSAQVVRGNRNRATAVRGVTPAMFDVRPWPVVRGRGLAEDDVIRSAKVALLGHAVAESLFGDSEPTGETIRINQALFTVIGVMGEQGHSVGADDLDDQVIVPLTTARKRVMGYFRGRPDAVGGLTLRVAAGADMDEAAKSVRALLRERHRLGPSAPDDFVLRDLAAAKRAQSRSQWMMTAMLASTAAMSFIVGAVGIMNLMLVSIGERRAEIGLRMAIGAKRREIAAQFLIEAGLLAILGAGAGVLMAALGAVAFGASASMARTDTLSATALAVLVATLVTTLSAIYPARKAARLDPAEALTLS